MSANRVRMLNILRWRGRMGAPEQVAAAPIEELLDLRGFGVAMTYECRDWLAEHDVRSPAIEEWVEARAANSYGDPRQTRDPDDYSYETQTERRIYT